MSDGQLPAHHLGQLLTKLRGAGDIQVSLSLALRPVCSVMKETCCSWHCCSALRGRRDKAAGKEQQAAKCQATRSARDVKRSKKTAVQCA